jgi:hypothetical protein
LVDKCVACGKARKPKQGGRGLCGTCYSRQYRGRPLHKAFVRAAPGEQSTAVQTFLPPTEAVTLRRVADSKGITISALTREVLRAYLRRQQ